MATQSPFSLLDSFLGAGKSGPGFTAPDWAVEEVRRRIVLLLNHVLMQESEAMVRLARQKGRVVMINWRVLTLKLIATPAGLLDVAPTDTLPDLTLALTQDSPLDIALALLRGDKPTVRIEGDVQLAAEVNWLADHVRWDIEDDLARVIGDVPARTLGQIADRMRDAVRRFSQARSSGAADAAGGNTSS